MLSRVLETIRLQALIAPGQSVLVGLSGGPDSWALLLALKRLDSRLQITVEAACVDHGLRAESASEAAQVKQACEAQGIRCACLKVNVRERRTAHVSWQDAARRARLDALEAFAAQRGCNAVALGHNADDQAETLLFRIVRGTGLKGLAGIPYKRGVFVRPLLDVRRKQIERFVARAKVVPIRDPSNESDRFARSRVRHQWLPFLARENPKVVEALLALGQEARAWAADSPLGPPGASANLTVGPAVGQALSRRAAAAVARLAAAGGSGAVSVPGGRVEVTYGTPRFVAGALPMSPPAAPAPVVVKSCTRRRKIALSAAAPALVLQTLAPEKSPTGQGVFLFDAHKLVWPLTVRTWEAGDRMRPRGGQGGRKLQDLFVDAKVPRAQRRHLPVLTDAEGVILFVPGLRPSGHAVPGPQTRVCLAVGLEKSTLISPK